MSQIEAVTDLILEVFRLNGALVHAGDTLVAGIGLTSARWQVLGAIALAAQPLSVAGIARTMGLSRQAVLRLTKEMVADGLLRLADNPHHRRARLVLMTPAGETAFGTAMARHRPWAEKLAGALDRDTLNAASALLRGLRQHLETQRMDEVNDD
ncbi:MAG: helix-turn-helix domain-containing protein [Ancalomicrobiaceae bacterium]|nr:helix-turn-helix domain-containing protein [Ancalomicrobiaceae bacterium]